MNLLSNACVESKVKYGCAVWNALDNKQKKDVNDLKVNLFKRVMELPQSTPSTAIMYEFGLTDLDLDVEMERILLMCNMLKKMNSVAKNLLQVMLAKQIPGFCVELIESMKKFNLQEGDELFEKEGKIIRKHLKKETWQCSVKELARKCFLSPNVTDCC